MMTTVKCTALQNIGASNSDDAFYRYKMPKMITKIEGRGNGIKTNIVNMSDIAKALARPASYATKFFACELGAQSKLDPKSGAAIVNGAHDTPKLAGLLESFIKKYVQCYECGNPETEIVITKTQTLRLKCAACGFRSDVDMRDKLSTFIVKNPPDDNKSSKDKKSMRRAEKERIKEGEAADEEKKRLKKKEAVAKQKPSSSKASTRKKGSGSDEDRSPAHSQDGADDDKDDNVQWQTDTSLEAAKQRVQQQLSSVTAGMVTLSMTEEEKTSAHDDNSNAAKLKPVEEIKECVKKGSSPSQVQSFLWSLSGTKQEIMDALVEALFEGVGKGFAKEAAKKNKYLAAAAAQDRGSQTMLLRALESFCTESSPDAVKEVALVLKNLYDEEVLEEEFVLEWYQKGLAGDNKNSPIWKNADPFIEWLRSAESESEED